MTGADLLKALLALTDDQLLLDVVSEGCDCDGDVGSVDIVDICIYLRRGGREAPESVRLSVFNPKLQNIPESLLP